VDDAEIPFLADAINVIRRKHRLPEGYVMKYSGMRPSIRASFFDILVDVPFNAFVSVVDKSRWDASTIAHTSGWDRVSNAITDLVLRCPPELPPVGILLIDLPASEMRLVTDVRIRVRKALRAHDRRSFRKVKPCPDHRLEGVVVQFADMLAGAISDEPEGDGPYLAGIRRFVQISS